MDVFIYFYDRLPCGLDEIEDRITHALYPFGEVTGSGSGNAGSNVDIDVADQLSEHEVRQRIQSALADLSLPATSEIKMNGKSEPL